MKTVTVATRISADDRADIEWLADYHSVKLSDILDMYGTNVAVIISQHRQREEKNWRPE